MTGTPRAQDARAQEPIAAAPAPSLLVLWSAPRCRSTAFLRMMQERGDFEVVHEPLSHVVDFGEAEIAGRRVHSEPEALEALLARSAGVAVFFKDTTDFHYPALLAHEEFLRRARHTFIIRDPAAAIASHHRVNPDVTRDEIGFERLYEIYERVVEVTGQSPPVVEADDLVRRPESTVRAYCQAVGIPFRPEALQWDPGWRDDWKQASAWHVEASERPGFAVAPDDGPHDLGGDERLLGYLRHHAPFYERLRAHALR